VVPCIRPLTPGYLRVGKECPVIGCLGLIAALIIIAGLMNALAKGRPDIGIPMIGVGIVILVAIGYSSEKRRKRIANSFGPRSKPRFDSQGRFYCNACGGYVSRHDPSNHPESN
jgi:hypothetical protein